MRRSGDELFHGSAGITDHALLDFWRWASSDLLSNATRGVLAEYIVGLALGCADGTRREWDAADLLTDAGTRVEVKSAAYLQTWTQAALSKISFGIQPTRGWDAVTNTVAEDRRRQADVYVFALLQHRLKTTVDPLDLDQWAFYVLPTKTLDERAPEQRSISLSGLLALEPEIAAFDRLKLQSRGPRHRRRDDRAGHVLMPAFPYRQGPNARMRRTSNAVRRVTWNGQRRGASQGHSVATPMERRPSSSRPARQGRHRKPREDRGFALR